MITTEIALTPADVAQFHAEGYVLQRGVFAGAQLAALTDQLDVLSGWTAETRLEKGQRVKCAAAWLTAEANRTFTAVRKLTEHAPAWQAVCAGVLQADAARLLGEPAIFDHALGIVKPPQIGQTFPLHQDGIYYGPSDGHMVLANVYLDDVTPDNGSLRVVPRSHERLLAHHTKTGKKALDAEDFSEIVTPQAKSGDVLWFHIWAVHGSAPNTTERCRRAVRVGYRTGLWA